MVQLRTPRHGSAAELAAGLLLASTRTADYTLVRHLNSLPKKQKTRQLVAPGKNEHKRQ
jgi:hypothetical protein